LSIMSNQSTYEQFEHADDGANADPTIYLGHVQVGLQPNQRWSGADAQEAARVAIEADGNQYEFSLTLGSVTEADADAIAIPSNPWFGLGGGAVENALVRDMDKIAGAKEYAEDGPGSQFFGAAEQWVRNQLGQPEPAAKDHDRQGVPFGVAAAFPSGPMTQRGIDNVVLVNVLPDAQRGEDLTAVSVSLAVRNALRAAEHAGATSMAISEIGTGFMAAMGGSPFKTRAEAWDSIFSGYMEYIEMARTGQVQGTVNKLSLAVYADANEENAQTVGEMLTGVVDALVA
jgi:O-acetyl-ADP-ribose deacetylase (regulator of RNase III)